MTWADNHSYQTDLETTEGKDSVFTSGEKSTSNFWDKKQKTKPGKKCCCTQQQVGQEESIIRNLSSYLLSEMEERTLGLGLGFMLTPNYDSQL